MPGEELVIESWSYSRLQTFESCKLRAKLQYVDKIPEPPRPLPPGKTEHANDRGTRIHEAAELFVKGGVELMPELKTFEEEFWLLRGLYREGVVLLEGECAVDENWMPVAWNSSDVWLRTKRDALVWTGKDSVLVIDYKSGRKQGNEIKHAEQGQLYQLETFLRYPTLNEVVVEFWYTDIDDLTRTTYSREQGLRFLRRFEDRAKKLTNESEFKPSPSKWACKWCPYNGTEHCSVGV